MKAIQVTLSIILIAAAGYGYIHWMNSHDDALDQAMSAYDACVHAEYGVSAASYYQTHGVTADCK